MKVTFESLKNHLIKEKINITDQELKEAIKIFEACVEIILEFNDDKYRKEASVIIKNNLDFIILKNFYNLFIDIIKLQKLNLLCYIDVYVLLDEIGIVVSELDYILDRYDEHSDNDDDFYSFYAEITANRLDYLSNDKLESVRSIPNYYKKIIYEYNNALDFYFIHSTTYDLIESPIEYEYFLNMSYYYFMVNGLLDKETDKICKFIKSTTEDIPGILERFNIYGVKESKTALQYVDSLYRNFKSKSKVKQIK